MKRRSRRSLCLLVLFLRASLPAWAADKAVQETGSRAISHKSLWVGGGLVLGTLALGAKDAGIQEDVPVFSRSRFPRSLDLQNLGEKGTFFEQLGGPEGVLAVSGGFYLTGLLAKSPAARKTGVLVFESFFFNEVRVLGL